MFNYLKETFFLIYSWSNDHYMTSYVVVTTFVGASLREGLGTYVHCHIMTIPPLLYRTNFTDYNTVGEPLLSAKLLLIDYTYQVCTVLTGFYSRFEPPSYYP